MMIIKNRQEIINELAKMLKQFDKELNEYQTDIYAYYDEKTQEVALKKFTNVGGDSWIDDNHATIYCDKPRFESIINNFQTIEEIADVIEMSFDELVKLVAEKEELDVDDVDWCMVCRYADDNFADKIQAAYEDILDDMDSEYLERAENIVSDYENDSEEL